VVQHDPDDEDDQQEGQEERQRHVGDRRLEIAGRSEQGGVDVDPGEAGLHRGERLLDVPADLEGIGIRELLDDEDEPRRIVDHGVADERLVVLHDRGDVAEHQLGTRDHSVLDDGDLGEVIGRRDREDVLDPEPLVGGIDEPARARG
jgi:hypothetical protein